MKTFFHDIYDSHNTCFTRELKARDIVSAIHKAQKYNLSKHIIKESNTGEWAELNGQEVVSASNIQLFTL